MTTAGQSSSRAIIVVGAYGSGSSAVAGILNRLGIMMGEKLVPATKANPKGHFEDAEFRKLLYRYRRDRSILPQIHAFIERRFLVHALWGLKEPAILEAIFDIAPALSGKDYKVIATIRNIEACVRSYLRKWPGADPEETRKRIEHLNRQRDRFFEQFLPDVLWVDFNELTEDPKKNVLSIVRFVFGDSPEVPDYRAWPLGSAIQDAADSIDPAMNHSLEYISTGRKLAPEIPFHDDPILEKWVNPNYLCPETIAHIKEASRAKPFCKYSVLDDFFNEEILDAYLEQHRQLEFAADDEGLPYDSNWAVARKGESLGAELFYYEPWHRLLAEYTDTELEIGQAETSVKLRKHDPESKGFWIHTDRTRRKSRVALAALTYLNKDWKESHGGLLQIWAEVVRSVPVGEDEVEYRWQEFKDQRLEFLNERYSLKTHLVTYDGIRPAEMFLIDQVLPEYNRLVVTDFVRDPAYHAITPSNGRTRYGIVQWLM